ncbi:MAG TPA: carbohydrate ABC transporter permease [Chloroflexota bacterium]|jgi:multiple sugar transport system permease protein|nr:carbohydrate ABC transporter permease [Chloroflexota bacterium]
MAATDRSTALALPRAAARRRPWTFCTRHVLAHAVLVLFSTMFIIPFLWLLSTSFKPESQIFVWPPIWIPEPITFDHYLNGLRFLPFGRFTLNSLVIAVSAVVGTLISCSLAAYGLARIRWPGRNILFAVILATLLIPFQVRLIPLFIIFKNLGWIDTFLPLIVPTWFGNAFFIFLLRQFFLTIPQELSEAAKIDGASEVDIFSRVILPLARPALATVALFEFLARWDDFLGPLIFLSSQENYTVSLGLAMFRGQQGSFWGMLMAVSTVMALPIIVLFFFTQRTFIQGITLTGIKG